MRLLLAEDDKHLGESLRAALELDGYAVDWLRRGDEASAAVSTTDYDALIVDIGLPGQSGLDIVRELRGHGLTVPVLLLTARDAVADRVRGLDSGADDYLSKPFDMDELFARLRSLLRRSAGIAGPALQAGPLALNPQHRTATYRGQPLVLSAKELDVLEILLRNRRRFVSKARLEQGLYNWDDEVESNTVEVYISRLRKQLGGSSIETLRGVGYRLVL